MKRYRIAQFDFDTRANLLNYEIKDEWEDKIKKQHIENRKKVINGIISEYGNADGENKINRFIELGPKPISIIAYHNSLLDEIRKSYIMGAYYPALISSCTLGERILNHLILDLRDKYKHLKEELPEHPCVDCNEFQYLKENGLVRTKFDIYTCKDCSNWNLMINELSKWEVFNNDVKRIFKKLSKKRHKSVHFNEKTIVNLKRESIETVRLLQKVIQTLFPAWGSEYFIPARGEAFLKKELESKPFFKKYYIPNSKLVSPYHKVTSVRPIFNIEDIELETYDEVSDDKFVELRNKFLKDNIIPKFN